MSEPKTETDFETPAVVVGQKRSNSENGSGPASKKPNTGDPEVQVKVLIPAGAVGALIGKGGEAMRQLKTDSGCRVQMSKNQEMFHNTNERICLVKGKVTACMMVMKVILEKIQEKIESNNPADPFDLKGLNRPNEMKIVVPNTSAGMVIGKSGASIKEIRESTGANIQVYPKAGSEEAKQSMERVITVGAEQNQVLLDAISKVLEKVAADPLHAQEAQKTEQYPSSQSFAFGRVDSTPAFGGLSSFGGSTQSVWQSQTSIGEFQDNKPYLSDNGFNKSSSFTPQIKYNGVPVLNNNEVISFLDNLQGTLRTSGFTESAVAEIMQAMNVLARYNIMGLGLGLGVATMAQSRQSEPSHQILSNPGQSMPQRYDLTQSMISNNGLSSILDNDRSESLNQPGGVLIDVLGQSNSVNESFAATVIKERVNEDGRLELEVPDAIVGAVLGPKAKTLVEIQQLSGCKVEVHKRGTGNASTGHRLISLTGSPSAIANGRQMVEKVINNEQARRQPASNMVRSGFA
ncbi:unnamed protein product [Bursaphelenchus xylophilus]|uniref:(pine wood nematode) hypothetical protein n=1 Tax=Bursaphelenchus xylophilus TaxID=6326 RepID=A0A1I7RTE1_BURXY|nr:unnamed protein product [Bursaphelenchus xylophilus]CAG9122486.1 unnamed protein product [Bursaphelenchus xylophilus]